MGGGARKRVTGSHHARHGKSAEDDESPKAACNSTVQHTTKKGPPVRGSFFVSKWMKRNHDSVFASYKFNIIALLLVLGSGFFVVRFLFEFHDDVIASHSEIVTRHFIDVPCSHDYDVKFKACIPKKCGRCVADNHFSGEEINSLWAIAVKAMRHGGSDGGATILDLNSGALSKGERFVNIYKMQENIFTAQDFKLYNQIKNRIHSVIAKEFSIPLDSLYLTKPTFFSRMTSTPARTLHDEYWHVHVDKVTYGSFDYTSLLYLSEYEADFEGGRFFFVDKWNNKSVEPRPGRLSFFTSGSENSHFVERVTHGTRFALTVSFTCDKRAGIGDLIHTGQ